MGHPQTALEDGPTCWRIRWWVFAGWAGGGCGRTTLGSLDPSFLPAVPSHCRCPCPAFGLFPFVSILPPLYLGCLIPNWSGAIFCLFLVSCLRFPLKSEPLQEVSLGLSAALCPLLVPTLGQDSGLLRFLPPCLAQPMAPAVGGVGLTFQLASALACSRGPWVSSLI